MGKIIAICGKICSGKTWYARQLMKAEAAVLLSCDEVTRALFDNDLGDRHHEMTARIRCYLRDDGLMAKLQALWQPPEAWEMDVTVHPLAGKA